MPAKTKLYRTLSQAMPDLIGEYIAGAQPADLYAKYAKVIQTPFGMNTLYVYLNKHGASQARKAAGMKMVKVNGNHKATPRQRRALVQTAQLVRRQLEQKALEHTERMTAQIDKIYVSIDKEKITRKNRSRILSDVDRWDQVARRTFQMDDKEEMGAHTLNLAILTNLKAEDLKEASGTLLDRTESPQEELESFLRVETAETGSDAPE